MTFKLPYYFIILIASGLNLLHNQKEFVIFRKLEILLCTNLGSTGLWWICDESCLPDCTGIFFSPFWGDILPVHLCHANNCLNLANALSLMRGRSSGYCHANWAILAILMNPINFRVVRLSRTRWHEWDMASIVFTFLLFDIPRPHPLPSLFFPAP